MPADIIRLRTVLPSGGSSEVDRDPPTMGNTVKTMRSARYNVQLGSITYCKSDYEITLAVDERLQFVEWFRPNSTRPRTFTTSH